MSDIAISVKGLGKRYRLGAQSRPGYRTIRESLVRSLGSPLRRFRTGFVERQERDLWALRDLSFDVKFGEVLGIIGRNGAGKSTVLKVLSRITEPTTGYADVFGRVGSLLEVGTGFHPELTGRENIFLNGAILGMSRLEIRRRFDEIVSFAELERFLETPVKHYSSGMYMRLAFSVAAHIEPEVLVVDEVLAVGDAEFQKKCLGKLEEVASHGRTVLFVSHNMAAIQKLASRAVVLQQGRIVLLGSVAEAISKYAHLSQGPVVTSLSDRIDRKGDGRLRFTHFETLTQHGIPGPPTCGEAGALSFGYQASSILSNVSVSIGVFTALGEGALYLGSELVGCPLDLRESTGSIVCRFDKLPLLPGTYTLNVYCTVNGLLADWIVEAARFDVIGGDYFGTGRLPPQGYGTVAVSHTWEARPVEAGQTLLDTTIGAV
jgi:lipopolysaccharide transport system ATP-binding protein